MIEPKLPGTDLNDPKVLAGAKRVATRRNNEARRKLAKERAALPLFAGEIPSEPAHLVTPEEVIERRALVQHHVYGESGVREANEIFTVVRYRNEVFDLVTEAEYAEFYAASFDYTFPQWAYWGNLRDDILRRREPMPPFMELVLTWLVDWEGEPPTILELHHLRGDGLTSDEISKAIHWLDRQRYVRGGVARFCRFVAASNPWINNSIPFEATDAGVDFINARS
jgi:hypothetical protein